MNRLKSVLAATVLTLALAISATGQAPACNPGETQTPPEAQSVEIVSLVELALSVLLLA